jgi:hypothetical protein
MATPFAADVRGPFDETPFQAFEQTFTITQTGNIKAILAGIGHTTRATTFVVAITPQNSGMSMYPLVFSAKGSSGFARVNLPQCIFVVAGEQLKVEVRAQLEESRAGTVQRNAKGHVRMLLLGDSGLTEVDKHAKCVLSTDETTALATPAKPKPNSTMIKLGVVVAAVWWWRSRGSATTLPPGVATGVDLL